MKKMMQVLNVLLRILGATLGSGLVVAMIQSPSARVVFLDALSPFTCTYEFTQDTLNVDATDPAGKFVID